MINNGWEGRALRIGAGEAQGSLWTPADWRQLAGEIWVWGEEGMEWKRKITSKPSVLSPPPTTTTHFPQPVTEQEAERRDLNMRDLAGGCGPRIY